MPANVKIMFFSGVVAFCALASSCHSSDASSGNLVQGAAEMISSGIQPAAQTPSTKRQGGSMDDLKTFATNGNRILSSATGDLNGAGKADALLVLDPPADDHAKLGEGPARTVLLLIRDAAGTLHEAARNDKIVPCAECGGLAGDPFGYIRIEPAGFTIANGGGGREHWTNEYHFKYSSSDRNWLLDRVLLRVVDGETDVERRRELAPKDFGMITFQDFDPVTLPKVELP